MNTVLADTLPDVQESGDTRGVALDDVGVAGMTLPVTVLGPTGAQQASIASAELSVALDATVRGTHMSRLIEEAASLSALTPMSVVVLSEALCERLNATASHVLFRFPLFVERPAPDTGRSAPHRYEAWLRAKTQLDAPESPYVGVGVRAAITSLCPCSREISDYGAHSQRGHVEVEVESPAWRSGDGIWPQELFRCADEAGSAQIYPLLKRPDERMVTMLAYDRPAFVEDIAREVVTAVKADSRCAAWSVSVVNQESIHDHQAVARVRGRR